MDALIQNYLNEERKSLLYDWKHRSEDQTWINRAYAMMLTEQGLLSKEDYRVIDRGLVAIQNKLGEAEISEAGHNQDLHFIFEDALYREIGEETGCKLHVGRSRNDLYFTQFRMSLRKAVVMLAEEVLETQKLLEEKAAENLETVIPYYTYGQPAQPGTWGHYLVSIHQCFQSDMKRLRHAYETVNQCPMGSAAGIGSAFPLNKYRMAELLGFDGVIENTMMANSAVDYYLELESAMGILTTTLGRVGCDLNSFASMEVGILEGDPFIFSGSSIMPQKKNYSPGSQLRSRSFGMYGGLMNAFVTAGSVSMFPVYETFRYFDEFWEHLDTTVSSLKILRLALERSVIRKETALRRARDGFTAATHMAEQLTMEVGEPFVKTHHIVGHMVHALMDEDRLVPENMTSELMKEASVKALGFEVERTDAQIAQMLDPISSLNAKVTGGTPKPADTGKLLADARSAREEMERWLASVRERTDRAYAAVEQGIV